MTDRKHIRRFLAAGARGGNGHGYLSQPQRPVPVVADEPAVIDKIAAATSISDEPQALDGEEWKRHIKSRATQTAAQRRTAEEIARDRDRRLLSQEERIAKAHARAQTTRRDVKREMWVLDQMKAQGKSPDKIEKRLQNLEQIVYLGRAA